MNSSATSPFSDRFLRWVIGVGVAAFVAGVAMVVFNIGIDLGDRAGTTVSSRSAVGHHAFYQLLRRLKIPVSVSRSDTVAKLGPTSILVMLEPTEDPSMIDIGHAAGEVLLVLPKWRGSPIPGRAGWIENVNWQPRARARQYLGRIVPDGRIVRTSGVEKWDTDHIGIVPTLAYPQLIRSEHLQPVIAAPGGILLGQMRTGNTRFWVLSDPDVIANHGLGVGDNGQLAVAIISAIRQDGGQVVIDETIHGAQQPPNLWRSMFLPPFVVATLHGLAALIFLVFATTRRFGAPRPAVPEIQSGKVGLIETTSGLFTEKRHMEHIVRRYLAATVRDVERRLHAPPNMDETTRVAWFEQSARARGIRGDLQNILARFSTTVSRVGGDPGRLTPIAALIHQWKQEMVNGSGADRGDKRKPQGGNRQGHHRSGGHH